MNAKIIYEIVAAFIIVLLLKRFFSWQEIIRAVLISLWVYAAIIKLLDYEKFNIQLGKSPLLTSFAPLIAVVLPAVELLIAALLFIRPVRMLGLYASLFLMVLFTSYLIAILNFSYDIPCACGGILSGLSWKSHIVFNIIVILVIVAGILLERKQEVLSNANLQGQLL